MLKKVQIMDAGDTNLIAGDFISKVELGDANAALEEGETPAQAMPLLQGITKASLSTDSFISAASFQETTKVLTQAHLKESLMNLEGLKKTS
jgi:DNA-directed RNA polymerase subunit beta'